MMTNQIIIQVRVAPCECWSCQKQSQMVSSIRLTSGENSIECSVTDLGDYSELVDEIRFGVPLEIRLGALKTRFSRTLGRSYMSNGCAHCDALFGAHYEIHTRYDEHAVPEFVGKAQPEWQRLFDALQASEDGHLL